MLDPRSQLITQITTGQILTRNVYVERVVVDSRIVGKEGRDSERAD